MDCIFCKIISGEIPCSKVHEDDLTLVFKDINPIAPVHLLIIPKEHIASAAELGDEHRVLLGHMFAVISDLAKKLDLSSGFRIVTNCGSHAGQTVDHLHFHLLAGRELAWPPG